MGRGSGQVGLQADPSVGRELVCGVHRGLVTFDAAIPLLGICFVELLAQIRKGIHGSTEATTFPSKWD